MGRQPSERAMSDADLTWNRACEQGARGLSRRGDAALSAMLLFHSLAMNGGVRHAVECLTPTERDAALRGYAFFGFGSVDRIIEAARRQPADDDEADELEARLDAEYAATVSIGDSALLSRFREHFAAHPEDYAPLA